MFEVSHVFKSLFENGLRSMIITSGTLSPMD
jgi:regulator of telomere elongation helicase 1